MEYTLLETAFAALMHDIGKFYQRTKIKSDLNEEERLLTPIAKQGAYHTHLHSGYTSRFLREYLKLYNKYERLTSAHHLAEEDDFSRVIRNADWIASSIDRNDEKSDVEEKNATGNFQTARLSSVIGLVDFGKVRTEGTWPLTSFSELSYPSSDYELKSKQESVEEYKRLFESFVKEVSNSRFSEEIDQYAYDRMYALLYEYAALIPASTYESSDTAVSLFDHLKLTSAIASCLYYVPQQEKKFVMLEFDISGIQKFIFKITEGAETKEKIAKSLRGRSYLISLITNIITYSYLYEFKLTQANIIFNTGGGAVLLLPNTEDLKEKIVKVSSDLKQRLFEMFGSDITYVYSYVYCDENELELFKTEKAIQLKTLLEEEKTNKFSEIMDDSFFFSKAENDEVCEMCGNGLKGEERGMCAICQKIIEISDFLVKHEKMYILYDFDGYDSIDIADSCKMNFGNTIIYLIGYCDPEILKNTYTYIESVNHRSLGNCRSLANLVPIDRKGSIINFEDMCERLIGEKYGDKKLGILKMDVDNLGAIFAFGLEGSRSLSKFLTLSRLMENFFSNTLVDLCLSVSERMNERIKSITANGTMFYIDYAGGDDLVIIGPAAGIIYLGNEIERKFSDYTLNKNITISGGIHIQHPKAPIRFGISRAEQYLSASKELDEKNGMTLIGTTCSMDGYDVVLHKSEKFKSYINSGYISRSVFYQIMKTLDLTEFTSFYRLIPRIFYSLKRNVQDEMVRSVLLKEISTVTRMEELRVLVLEMKLAIMQTREE